MNTWTPQPPRHRSIIAVDAERSTERTNPAKAHLRNVMYELFEEALRRNAIAEYHRDDLVDRGDGAFVLVHPVDEVPKTVLLAGVVPTLAELLADAGSPFRLRVVVHFGEIHYDRRGCYGEALDIAFRLLDAKDVKDRLRRTRSPLVLVVSDDLYRSVVRHGYDGIDSRGFSPGVRASIGGQDLHGWTHVPQQRAHLSVVDAG